jgi:hypothetical protein
MSEPRAAFPAVCFAVFASFVDVCGASMRGSCVVRAISGERV